MSDTPRTDAAYFAEGATMYDLAGEAKKMERELNEANADRLRLRQSLTQAGAGQFLATISATPLPAVVAKADADALADALEKALHNASSGKSWYVREACVETLETYRTKYPTT
jgi:hypothetical protein